MKKTKSIRFETIERKKIREKNDKEYRHVRQHAKTLCKNNMSSNSLFEVFFVSTSTLTFLACRQCNSCKKYKDFFQFFFLISMKNFDQYVDTVSLMTIIKYLQQS